MQLLWSISQSPCTALMSGIFRAVQGDCQWPLKNGGNSHWSHDPIMHQMSGVPRSIYRSTNYTAGNTANWRPTDIPTATSVWLCNSLAVDTYLVVRSAPQIQAAPQSRVLLVLQGAHWDQGDHCYHGHLSFQRNPRKKWQNQYQLCTVQSHQNNSNFFQFT